MNIRKRINITERTTQVIIVKNEQNTGFMVTVIMY